MLTHPPGWRGACAPPFMLRDLYCYMFKPRPGCSQDGAFVLLNAGRSPQHHTKECQQQQDNKASHAATLLYQQAGVCTAPGAGGKPRNGVYVAWAGEEGKGSALVLHRLSSLRITPVGVAPYRGANLGYTK